MSKTTWIILAAAAAVALMVGLVGAVGVVAAQAPTPTVTPQTQFGMGQGQGMMGGRGGMRGLVDADGEGPLHETMVAGMAAKLGLTADELEKRLDAGETMWDVAQSKDMSQADFTTAMSEVRTQALAQAVTDGTLTQAQADAMQTRMGQRGAQGFGPGSCDGTQTGAAGQGGFGRRGGRR